MQVVDFGLSRQNTSAPVTLGAGTLDFIAPELVEGSYNRACSLYPVDVWGVGIVLYCLVTARMPFQVRCCSHAPCQTSQDCVSAPPLPQRSLSLPGRSLPECMHSQREPEKSILDPCTLPARLPPFCVLPPCLLV